ncbi:RodZ domain-containing protein [Biformimicrobium ophioploci]|uniref:Cytoskeleton protein RodZ n=1 Tax=Biformimicrobium ophioploci TaxID=3036711 RepID=A0ABQ6LZ85_9GAMM|nr:RodZ domain-containing protein [Microbulbifer sp. NKW57]GMG87396.1 cytoskeleton protein RodZ [Microbulbifer sp. NKW57]
MTDSEMVVADIATAGAAESPADDAHDPTPGTQLRRLREAAGVSREQLAKILCVTPTVLSQLESDQYERLAGFTYVRGYLRSACKYLEADPAPLLAGLEGYSREEVESRKVVESARAAGGKSGLGSGLLLLLAGLLIAGFWWSTAREMAPPQALPDSAADESLEQVSAERDSPLAVESVQREAVLEIPPVTDAELGALALEPEEELAEALPAARETASVVAAPEAEPVIEPGYREQTPAEARVVPVVVAAPAEQQSATVSAAVPATGSAAETRTEIAAGDLQLSFSDECWLEVSDAQGQVLLEGIRNAGDSVTLQGQAPYTLKLGHAAVVTAIYRGSVVDVAPRPGRRTRTLTVGN